MKEQAKKEWVEMLEFAYQINTMPKGTFRKIMDCKIVQKLPMVVLPLMAINTLGFKVFVERKTDKELVEAYAFRLDIGNTGERDAIKYRGRGFFHKTFVGKKNYYDFQSDSGIDVISDPDVILRDFDIMIKVMEWQLKNAVLCYNRKCYDFSVYMGIGIENKKRREIVMEWLDKWLPMRPTV